MIRDGDNFRRVDGKVAAWALGMFATSLEFYPALGTYDVKAVRQRVGWTEARRKAHGKRVTKFHASRLGIRLSEMAQYRNLRAIKHLTRDEAVQAIISSRRRRP